MQTIDSKQVTYKTLYNGAKISLMGLGTFGSDSYDAKALKKAIQTGYRHINCASVYGNEKEIGVALKEVFAEGIIKREKLWITSKAWNDKHKEVVESCK